MRNQSAWDNLVCGACGDKALDLYGAVTHDWLCWTCLVASNAKRRENLMPESTKEQDEIHK